MDFTKDQKSLLNSTAEYVNYLNKEYSSGARGFSKNKTMRHIAEIPAFMFLTDPDLLMFQKAQSEGDRKGCHKYITRFIRNYKKLGIDYTKPGGSIRSCPK